jgi:ketosteroid isomerase-like protein
VSVILIMRIKNGLIASVRDYTDNLTIASLGPPPVG